MRAASRSSFPDGGGLVVVVVVVALKRKRKREQELKRERIRDHVRELRVKEAASVYNEVERKGERK